MKKEPKYKELYESSCQAIVRLERRIFDLEQTITDLRKTNEVLAASEKQWAQDKMNQQNIIQMALNTSNATNNSYLEENKKLREQIQELQRRGAL
jgi:hypothetical protein